LPIHQPRPTRPPHPGNRSKSLDTGTRTNDQERERLLGNSLGSESAKRSRFRAPAHHAEPFRVRRDKQGFIQSGRYDSPKRCLLADAARRKNACGLLLPGGDTPGGPQGPTSARNAQAPRRRINNLRQQRARALQTLLTKTFFFTLNR